MLHTAGRLIALFHFLCAPLYARFDLSGYAKSLDFLRRDSKTGSAHELAGNRLRLDGRWQNENQIFDLRLISDEELIYGSLLSSQKDSLSLSLPESGLLDLDWTLSEKEKLVWRHVFYRAYATINLRKIEVTLGRQRIAWGQGRLWNPTDVINPYNPLSVEREERPGSDAADAKWNFAELSFLEAAYAPGRNWDGHRSLFLGRARINFLKMDWGMMGGKSGDEDIVGLDHAAQVFEGSLRSEWTYSFGSMVRRDFSRAVISYDYSFSGLGRPLYVLGEFYYNGIGERKKEDYPQVFLKDRDRPFVAKDYFGFGLGYDPTSLWRGEFYGIVNMDDGSAFLGPRILWQPIQDFEIGAGYQAFAGSDKTEYGSLKELAFLQVQWYFNLTGK
jgi:hypothetical protein